MSFTNNKQNRLLIIKLRNYGKNKNHESDRIDSHGAICHVCILHFRIVFAGIFCLQTSGLILQNNGQITQMASILIWTESTMGLISFIASLVAGCHLCSKHRDNMRKLGIALVLVFIAWLLCSNLLPAAVFYLAGNTRQTAFISVNIISMITTTSAYIYAYYMMYRAIKTK